MPIGAIVLAIGADVYGPEEGEFGFGKIPSVIGNTDFEDVLGADEPTFGGRPVRNVVYVQCVGSRGPKGNPECSRYCCQAAIRQAIQLREKGVNVVVLHRDVRVYSRGAEEMYRRARGMGVTFLRYDPEDPPRVTQEGDGAVVAVRAGARGFDVQIPADVVVADINDAKAIQNAVRRLLPGAEVEWAVGYDWNADSYARGTWCVFRPGQLTRYLRELQRPEGRVFYASGDNANGWRGFIDGAIESGLRAGREVTAALG